MILRIIMIVRIYKTAAKTTKAKTTITKMNMTKINMTKKTKKIK